MYTRSLIFPLAAVIVDDSSRAQEIIDSMKDIGFISIKMFPSVYSDREIPLVDNVAFKWLYGRDITSGEVGCALAHSFVYRALNGLDGPWFLVLEDSARLTKIMDGDLKDLFDFANSIESNEPSIINLHRPKDFVFARKTESELIVECLTILRMAKGYMINKAALETIVGWRGLINDVADWPEWITRIRQYTVTKELVVRDLSLPSLTNSKRDTLDNSLKSNSWLVSLLIVLMRYSFFHYRSKTKRHDFLYRILLHGIARKTPQRFVNTYPGTDFILIFNSKLFEYFFFKVKFFLGTLHKRNS